MWLLHRSNTSVWLNFLSFIHTQTKHCLISQSVSALVASGKSWKWRECEPRNEIIWLFNIGKGIVIIRSKNNLCFFYVSIVVPICFSSFQGRYNSQDALIFIYFTLHGWVATDGKHLTVFFLTSSPQVTFPQIKENDIFSDKGSLLSTVKSFFLSVQPSL